MTTETTNRYLFIFGKHPRFLPWHRNVSIDGHAPDRIVQPAVRSPPTDSIELMTRLVDPFQMRMCHHREQCYKRQCSYMHSIKQVRDFFAQPETIEFYRVSRLVRSATAGTVELARYETPRHFEPRHEGHFVVHRDEQARDACPSHCGLSDYNSVLLERHEVDFYVNLFDDQFRLIQPELTLVCPHCARRVVVPIYV